MTIFWLITKLGKSVRRVIREGSFALFRTSYKELSQHGIYPSSGVHHLFLKRDKFHSESAGFTLAITCLLHISPSSKRISVKFDIAGNLFSRRIQRRMLRRAGITSYGKRLQLPKLRHSDHPGHNWCISNPDLSFLDTSPYPCAVFPPFSIVVLHLSCEFQP